ncbi:CAP domain-containing protein [Streptomyces sp. 15-116A]|uniref:CAP domain-containing protein n=1 Tax=Streptomyces sp. 15-116A TaxID=2259035 RepID=UPI0021B40AD3|nr:CAP domain-containing protein [Streptomyces sp. 15-116A]MCT7353759.1 CAP domain-containing protein [Streptomyces sp. 15-116A]
MGKHRHQQRYRRPIVAAVAMGVIAIPSVAMACTDWPGDEDGRHQRTAGTVASDDRWDGANWYREWSSRQGGEPTALASESPSASPSKSREAKKGDSGKPSKKAKKPKAEAAKTSQAPKPAKTATAQPSTTAPKPPASPAPASPSAPKPSATASGAVARVVELVNTERSKAGCSAVKVNSALTKAAQDHSEDMAATGTMSHTGSDGSSPDQRITRAGYSWSSYGENVAYGYSTPEQVMQGWMNSPGHRENILNCSFKEIGVGLAQPGHYWTQDFGTAR